MRLTTLTLMSVLSLTAMAEPDQLWQMNGFDQPESVVMDKARNQLLVSNINGHPMELDGKGYISLMDADGKLLNKLWVTGLDAPKGMAVSGDWLYVADMQKLHKIDLTRGVLVESAAAPDAKMLNDVTVSPDGTVYVSDLIGGGIYRLQGKQLAIWMTPEQLPHPNGLVWQQDSLVVAEWGRGLNADFSTDQPGSLYRVNPQNQQMQVIAEGYQLGNLDGVVFNGEEILVSDWINGALYKVGGNERQLVMQLPAGLADIGISNGRLYMPLMHNGSVIAINLD